MYTWLQSRCRKTLGFVAGARSVRGCGCTREQTEVSHVGDEAFSAAVNGFGDLRVGPDADLD
jgi:hypothetical protein